MNTLIVSDLDGTLLRSDGTMSSTSATTVNDFVARGGLFSYATARSFTSAARVTQALELNLPVVTYGGAMTVDPRTGRGSAPPMVPLGVTRRALAHEPSPILFAMHGGRDRLCWLPERADDWTRDFLSRRMGDPRLLPLEDWNDIDIRSVFYVMLHGDRAHLGPLQQELLAGVPHGPESDLVLSEDVYTRGTQTLEATSALATKSAAVRRLAEQVGAHRIICFGDNHNDLAMFAVADHSIAVANAAPAVRAAADEVIGTNDDDSVAGWIASHTRR